MLSDLDPGNPDLDPAPTGARSGSAGAQIISKKIRYLPDPADPAATGSGSGFAGSRSGEIRIWIRFCRIQIRQYPELDPFWPNLDPGSGSKDMVMDPFRL